MSDVSTGVTNDFSTLSGSISFTGLGSGTDFTEIVDQLVEIESIQKTRLETWKATWEAKIESMQSLNERMGAIEEAAGAMDTESEFMVRQAATSDSSKVTAIGTSSATTGAYNIAIGEDTKHILTSAGVASESTVISRDSTSNLVLELNGTSYTISIAADRTLSEVADDINTYFGALSNEITATVTNDGTTSNPYHLELKAGTGGDAYRINVTQSPLLFSLNYNDTVKYQSFSDGSTTSTATAAGQFTGTKGNSVSSRGWYQYDISLDGASDVTVGTDTFTLNYSVETDSGTETGSVEVSSSYQPGDNIEIHDLGLTIQLTEGVIKVGDSFSVLAYANDIDDAETSASWSGPAITTNGNYKGTVNKTYNFNVISGGSLDSGEARTLRWTDSTGGTGTVSVTDSDFYYEVGEGVYVSFAPGTDLVGGQTFSINVYAPDKQQAQDKGLAQATKLVHEGFSDDTITPVTTSAATFSFTYGGESVEIEIAADSTLSQLKNLINSDSDNPGVEASILNDGLGLPSSYRLVLTGTDSGAQYQITNVSHDFSGSSFSSTSGDVGGGFTRSQWATNSMLKIDGYPSEADEYLQRDENVINDVITGVAISVHDAGEAVVTISTDSSSILSNIEAFINAVNYAQDFIREETAYNADDEETGVLIGNYSYYIIKSRIDSILNTSVEGLDSDVDPYVHLSQIGIATNPDDEGRWEIDSTELLAAITADPEAVANLFIYSSDKNTDGVAKQMFDEMETMTDSTDGMLNVLIDNYNGIIDNIDKRIDYEERRIETYRERQLERFARLEELLSELNSESSAIESQIESLPSLDT